MCGYIFYVHTTHFNVCVFFCKHLSSEVAFEGLSVSTGPALHHLSQDLFILSAPPLSLHGLYLSPTLSRGSRRGGKDTPMYWESVNEKYEQYSRGKEGTSKRISGEMSGLINLHILCSRCILLKPVVRMTTRTTSSVAQAVAHVLCLTVSINITCLSSTATVQ